MRNTQKKTTTEHFRVRNERTGENIRKWKAKRYGRWLENRKRENIHERTNERRNTVGKSKNINEGATVKNNNQ